MTKTVLTVFSEITSSLLRSKLDYRYSYFASNFLPRGVFYRPT